MSDEAFRVSDKMFLAITGMLFAAVCVWLTVRIVNRRERWAKRTAVAMIVGALVAYPLSTGPADWMRANGWLDPDAAESLTRFYSPLARCYQNSPDPIRRAIDWYGSLWRR